MTHDEDLANMRAQIAKEHVNFWEIVRGVARADEQGRNAMGARDLLWWLQKTVKDTGARIEKLVVGFERRWPDGDDEEA